MYTKKIIAILSFCFVLLVSCNDEDVTKKETDSPIKGSIEISADESFAPVISEQVAMYEASYPGVKLNVHYKTESECINDFFNDSLTRMAIVTRPLTQKEEVGLEGNLGFFPKYNEVATDAIAVLVNKNSTDTFFTLSRLQDLLTGKVKNDKNLVFDGLKKTSTVRFIEDSILKGKTFDTSTVSAVKNSDFLIEYIATHPNAIGFVGINRIGNPEDAAQVKLLSKVKIALVQCDLCNDKPFILPTQQSILNRRYPLVRGLYYLLKENYNGLGSGFGSFLKYERGQLIFRRAYLGPIMNFNVRNVNLNENPTKK
jgi:phosphate transport system substrate-binding protein